MECMLWQTNMFDFKNTLSVQNRKWWLWNVFRSMEMWVKYNLNNFVIHVAQFYAGGSHLRVSQKLLGLFEQEGHRLLIILHQAHSDLWCSQQTSRHHITCKTCPHYSRCQKLSLLICIPCNSIHYLLSCVDVPSQK